MLRRWFAGHGTLASLGGRSGHALLLDCRSLTYEPVCLPD